MRELTNKLQEKGLGNGTVNRCLACLRRMLNLAREDGKLQMIPKIRMLGEPPARRGFLVHDKFEILVKQLPEHLRPLIIFLYFCGVRLGEAKQIQWPQINIVEGTVRLESDQTKSGEARTVKLPDRLITLLEERKDDPFVFDSTNLRKSWQAACVKIGLGKFRDPKHPFTGGYDGLIIHDLRRSAIRNLMKAGIPEKVAMAISGHKTRAVFDRYHIVDAEDVIQAMRRVENMNPVQDK